MYFKPNGRLPYLAVRNVFRRIDETARRRGFNGCGDAYDPPRLNTVELRLDADELFFAANLGLLPGALREAAIDRCRRIVATSTPRRIAEWTSTDAVRPRREPQAKDTRHAKPPLAPKLPAGDVACLVAAVRQGDVQ